MPRTHDHHLSRFRSSSCYLELGLGLDLDLPVARCLLPCNRPPGVHNVDHQFDVSVAAPSAAWTSDTTVLPDLAIAPAALVDAITDSWLAKHSLRELNEITTKNGHLVRLVLPRPVLA